MINDRQNKSILLAEEDADRSLAISGILQSAGYNVTAVNSGEESVVTASGNKQIDIILMGLEFTAGIDGTEAAKRILSARAVPVIFLASDSVHTTNFNILGVACYGILANNSPGHIILSSIEIALDLFKSNQEHRDSHGDPGRFSAWSEIHFYQKPENIFNARHRIVEFSLDHSPDEILQTTLDEACEITGSTIGFYHFVGDDEKTLILQGWSTRTLKEFCRAEGKGLHYDLDEAGIWCDAIRERKPVIHNDYASHPHRKALPPGHAPVTRELVVPIFRRNRIVAILGVGNKPQDYTESDIQIISFFADVAWETTEKKRSSEALAESEKKYRLLLDTANEAIIIAQGGTLKFVNRKTVDIFDGYTEEELLTMPFTEFIYPDDRKMVIENYVRRINGENVKTRYPFRVIIHGGQIKWVEVTSVLIEWDGKPATMNFYTDITERKNAEDELKHTEIFAQATLDALSTNIAILNHDGIIISVNRAWREFAAENFDDITGLCEGANYLSVCDKAEGSRSDEAPEAAAGIRAVMSGRLSEFSLEYPCHSPDEKRWFNMRITRFAYNGNIRIVVAHENISKRRVIEAELRSLSYVVEQSPVSIVITDTDGSIQYVNPATEQTTGYTKNELIGNNPRIFKSDYLPAEEYKKLWETITAGEYWRGEFHNKRKNGSYYWESATISPILDENGIIEHYAGIKEDITERKAAEEKIRNLLLEKELLLKEVHHRIKNNMNTIRGLLFLQANDLKGSPAADALHDAENRVQSMMILYDKLYCSHDFREISIKSYLEPLVDEIIRNFPNRMILNIHKNISDFVLDANVLFPLGIIINELLSNIMKYAFTGRDRGDIDVSASINGGRAEIALADNGRGISENISFESSTGFGLTLVNMLTAQIGGKIRIERGNGTKFVIEFDL